MRASPIRRKRATSRHEHDIVTEASQALDVQTYLEAVFGMMISGNIWLYSVSLPLNSKDELGGFSLEQ